MDPVVILLGLAIGTLVGMTGMGGASLMTPLLILVVGTAPVTAVGTDIFYGAITKSVGAYKHLQQKTVHLALAGWIAIGAVPAAIGGVWLIEFLQRRYGEDQLNQLVLGILGAALLVVGVATIVRSVFLREVIAERYAMHLFPRHIVGALATGVTTGLVIGLTSAGGGTLVSIILIAGFRLTPKRVVGTSIFQAAIVLWAAGIAHWVGGNVDFGLAANILVGSIPGVLIGSKLSERAPESIIRNLLGVVLIASAVVLIAKESVPASVFIPALAVATLVIVTIFSFQLRVHRAAMRRAAAAGAAT